MHRKEKGSCHWTLKAKEDGRVHQIVMTQNVVTVLGAGGKSSEKLECNTLLSKRTSAADCRTLVSEKGRIWLKGGDVQTRCNVGMKKRTAKTWEGRGATEGRINAVLSREFKNSSTTIAPQPLQVDRSVQGSEGLESRTYWKCIPALIRLTFAG
jgi:hypothetical protein